MLRLADPPLDLAPPLAPSPSPLPLPTQIPAGRLIELSGTSARGGASARTSTAVAILRHAQAMGEPAAWIQPQDGALFPPDLQESGIDLDALVVIHVPRAALPHGPCRAAELLLRSGAFGLLVLDLIEAEPPRASLTPWLGRMFNLARRYAARILLLTEKNQHADSLGPLVSLRIESRPQMTPAEPPAPGGFLVAHQVLKHKFGAPFDVVADPYRGPEGLLP